MGIAPLDTMLSAFGKRDDINSGGKQMPSHLVERNLSQSSPVATQIPHSVGAALALKMDKNKNIATATVGKEVQTKAISMKDLTLLVT